MTAVLKIMNKWCIVQNVENQEIVETDQWQDLIGVATTVDHNPNMGIMEEKEINSL